MSLLSGIKFIPKEKREEDFSRSDKKDHKKDKKRKRHEDKHSKHDKSSRKYDSEDDEVDMAAIAREEEERERAEWIKSKSVQHGSTSSHKKDAKSNSFKDIISSLKDKPSEYGQRAPPTERDSVKFNAYQLQQQAVNSDDSDREDEPKQGNKHHEEPPSAPAPMVSNHSAAQLFRDKLKKSVGKSSVNDKSSLDQHKTYQARMEYKNLLTAKKNEGEDMDEIFRNNVIKLGDHYKGTELGGSGAFGNGDKTGHDEEQDIDMKLFTRTNTSVDEEKLKKQALQNRQKHEAMTSRCRYCTMANMLQLSNSVIISKSELAYVIWKSENEDGNMGLIENCLEIVPMSHKMSTLQCEEEVHAEVLRYKQCLAHMYEREFGKGLLFNECAVGKYSHTRIEVTPIDKGMEADAKMYFKEAFLSCDEEWSQHKKNIELSEARPLSKAVPSHFEYLMIEWGFNGSDGVAYGGLVHPIENSRDISQDFCSDVLAGMLEVDILKLRRRKQVSGDHKSNNSATVGTMVSRNDVDKITAFRKLWSKYDWTQYM